MKASNKSPSRPWMWFGVICLASGLSFLIPMTLGYGWGHVVGLPFFALLPALMGILGGWHRKWSITLLGPPAILVAMTVGVCFSISHHFATVGPSPTWISMSAANQPGSSDPDYTRQLTAVIVLAVMLGISAAAHAITRGMRPPQYPPGHCRKCGQDLQFRVDRPCPACGEAVLCRNCGYNLTGNVSGICPECETGYPEPSKPC